MTLAPALLDDASPWGWGVTILYLAVAWRCRAAALCVGGPAAEATDAPLAGFWRWAALLLLLLGLNKQLDLQTAVIAAGRGLSHAQHWYAERRFVQAIAMAVSALLLAGALRLAWRHAGRDGAARTALAGGAVLALFLALRGAAMLHADRLPLPSIVMLHALFEPAALLLVLLGAERAVRRCAST